MHLGLAFRQYIAILKSSSRQHRILDNRIVQPSCCRARDAMTRETGEQMPHQLNPTGGRQRNRDRHQERDLTDLQGKTSPRASPVDRVDIMIRVTQ